MVREDLDVTEVRQLVTDLGPSLGYDTTHTPVFPEGRRDVCAVRRSAENGSSYGYDTIYLVWRDQEGQVQARAIADSRSSKDYIRVRSVKVEGGCVFVTYSSGGSFSGEPWTDTFEARLPD